MSFLDTARRALGSKSEDYYDDDREYDEEYDEYEEEPRKSLFSFLAKRSDDEYEDYEDGVRDDTAPRSYSSAYARSSTRERVNTGFSKPSASAPVRSSLAGVEVTVHYPTSLDDATRIIREVKVNKITIFDISAITSDEEARRVVDYIGGAAFGMECPFERLCPSIFCIAPVGVKIDAKKHRY